MPFATEEDVRLTFQLTDTDAAPPELVIAAIVSAHELLLQRLMPGHAADPPGTVVQGEVLLAGAALLRSLAAKDAATQVTITVGGQRVDTAGRFSDLMTMAEASEDTAWHLLAAYLLPFNAHTVLRPSATTPVLGDAE